MSERTSGTIRKCTVDGITFDVASDANFSLQPSAYETEVLPTSGKPMIKKTKTVPTAEGLDLLITLEEVGILRDYAESTEQKKFSVEYANGEVAKNAGQIQLGPYESEASKLPLTLLPEEDWVFFT